MRKLDEFYTTNNQKLYNRLRRGRIATDNSLCTICPPHRGENSTRRYKYPIKKEFQLKGKNYAAQRRFKQLQRNWPQEEI